MTPVRVASGTTAVAGEVYEPTRDALAALDRLEGPRTSTGKARIRLDKSEDVYSKDTAPADSIN